MAGGNGFYFAAAALLTSVVLGLLLYQSRWTASARGGGMFGHEGFAAAKGPLDDYLAIVRAGKTFKAAGINFCSLVKQTSTEAYRIAAKGTLAAGQLPIHRFEAVEICRACGEGANYSEQT